MMKSKRIGAFHMHSMQTEHAHNVDCTHGCKHSHGPHHKVPEENVIEYKESPAYANRSKSEN